MSVLAMVLTAVIALLHVYILYLEMFKWDAPRTRATFETTEEFAKSTKTMAANQGLYNGFLAAGLFWGLFAGKVDVVIFFLVCIVIAGVFGALTASKKIIYTQALPAFVTLLAVLFS